MPVQVCASLAQRNASKVLMAAPKHSAFLLCYDPWQADADSDHLNERRYWRMYMSWIPDARRMVGQQTFEQEAQRRLNPYGPAQPPLSQEPPTGRQRMRPLWSRLRALGSPKRKPSDDTREN